MKAVTSSIVVGRSPEEVFAFLDVLANHESFTDHFLVGWSPFGAPAGVGAGARMRVRKPGPADSLEMRVTAADPPRSTTEESKSAGGRRLTPGTYTLQRLPDGRTEIRFELAWLKAPLLERLIAPVARVVTRRANDTAAPAGSPGRVGRSGRRHTTLDLR
jgi:hypothetical protein